MVKASEVQPGNEYRNLRILREAPRDKHGRVSWFCLCLKCGREKIIAVAELGIASACGCQVRRAHTSHGLAHHPLYNICTSAWHRCYNPKDKGYSRYGARGIKIYDAWKKDVSLFVHWIEDNLGPKPRGCSLDRIDNDGDYAPGNLRWATLSEQARNRRKFAVLATDAELIDLIKAENKRFTYPSLPLEGGAEAERK